MNRATAVSDPSQYQTLFGEEWQGGLAPHSKHERESSAMNKNAMVEILTVLQKHQVPLQYGVALICKEKGIGLASLTEECGYHRNYLNQTLCGAIKPPPAFREQITKRLGIDPWLYANSIEF